MIEEWVDTYHECCGCVVRRQAKSTPCFPGSSIMEHRVVSLTICYVHQGCFRPEQTLRQVADSLDSLPVAKQVPVIDDGTRN